MEDKHCLTCVMIEKCTFCIQELGPKPTNVQLSTFSCTGYRQKETEIKLESIKILTPGPDDILVIKTNIDKISHKDLDEYRERFKEYTGLDNKIIFINTDDDISTIRPVKD